MSSGGGWPTTDLPALRKGSAFPQSLLPSAEVSGSQEYWAKYTRRIWSVVLVPLEVKIDAGEDGNAASRGDDRNAGIAAEIADQIVAPLLADVLDPRANARARKRQQVDGAIGLGHIVEGAPTG